jgi:adenylate kinase
VQRPTRPPRPWALTGTPGVGKSSVARSLAPSVRSVEVAELAEAWGCARGRGRATVVDLVRMRARWRRRGPPPGVDLVVGHLAHLLPVGASIVLRCHPVELGRRLRAARRGTRTEREENVVCEATDVIVFEASRGRAPVYEIDTTGRSPEEVARSVRGRLARGGPPRVGRVDWLHDPRVTAHLLDRTA